MIDDYPIVRYRGDQRGQVLQLQTELWSRSLSLNDAYFRWKFETNPYLDEPTIYLATHRGVIVGMRGFFGFALDLGQPGRTCRGLYADDSVVAPNHRGRGIMARIMRFAFADLAARGHENLFNLSAGPATLHTSLQMGWCSAGWMRPMHRKSFGTRLRRRVRRVVGNAQWPVRAGGLRAWFGVTPSAESFEDLDEGLVLAATRRFPRITVASTARCAEMAELVAQVTATGKLRHVRDSGYFSWRFANPLSRYRFIYWDEGGLGGYLVLQEYSSDRADREVVNIVDWEARTPVIRAALLDVATALARGRVMRSWSASLPRATVELLRSRGFRVDREPQEAEAVPSLIMRPLRAVVAADAFNILGVNALDLANWDLRMLFSMLG